MKPVFLTAEWRKLAVANYIVDPQMLGHFLPAGTELDLYEGNCFISLVGFMFRDTRIKGWKIPFHTNFEEVNLRFYVKYKDGDTWKRGVVFIKEIVPKYALTLVANTIYNERYERLPMRHTWSESSTMQTISYQWRQQNIWHSISMSAGLEMEDLETDGLEAFILEHYWGYSKRNTYTTSEYEVIHPVWQTYKVHEAVINVDFGSVYGSIFAGLTEQRPHSVLLAEGSEVAVCNGSQLFAIN